MKHYRLYQIDAFTNELFKGNPASVIANADGLNETEMQNIARELNNSETAFIFKASSCSYDYRVRFFTPTTEVPSCGHASISTAYVWAKERNFNKVRLRQRIGIGTLPLEIVQYGNKKKVFMTQGDIKLGEVVENSVKNEILEALKIKKEDLIQNLPIQSVSTGHGKIIVPIKSKSILNSIEPDYNKLTEVTNKVDQNGFFLFSLNSEKNEVLTNARMFAPKIGINEDPVTGNGNGPLGAYLVHNKVIPFKDKLEFISHQGEKMNRSGYAHVIVEINNERPIEVKVGGECITVFKTIIRKRNRKNL